MKNSGILSEKELLKQKAEMVLKNKLPEGDSPLSVVEMEKLIRELKVHQKELELQNNELRLAGSKYQALAERYTELYDRVPLGCFTLDNTGTILECNQHGSQMLGKENSHIQNRSFASFIPPDTRSVFNLFLDKVFQTKNKETCKVMLLTDDDNPMHVLLTGITSDNQAHCDVTVVDITGRVHEEQELIYAKQNAEENRKRFQSIFRVAPAGIGVVKDGIIIEVNPKLLEITGYTEGDLVGQSALLLYSSKEEPDSTGKEKEKQINETGTVEAKWRKKDGNLIDVLLATSPVYAGDNSKGVAITVFDITSHKLAESIFKDIIEKNPMSIQILDMNGHCIQTNPAHTKLFGATPPPDYSVFHDTQLLEQGLGELFEKIKQGEIVHFPDSYFNTHDVDPTFPDVKGWIRATGFALNDSNGVPERIVLMQENISDRKHMEALFQDIIDKNPMSIQIVDKEGYTIKGNPAYVRLFGALPPPDFSIFADLQEKGPELEKLISLAKQGDVVHFPDIYYNTRDVSPDLPDNPVWIRALLFPINSREGKPERFVFMHENITDRKLYEQELRKAKEQAEESDRLKSAFLANMSHEIRTPMNSVLGFVGLLKKHNLSGEKQKEFIGIIEKSGARLLNTINDIISISKIESGLMQVSMVETDVSKHIDYIFNVFKHEAEEKELVLIVDKYPPLFVETDSEKLYGILTNLVKNAIKFTHSGSIEFGYKKKEKHLEFFVKDTGAGLPKEKKDLIFERFRQGTESDARNFEGAGLGLAISKAYVEMLGGEIWVESEYGKGSQFYFTIPLEEENS